jgi:predicted nuclease of predicted toxin-antitoxin system
VSAPRTKLAIPNIRLLWDELLSPLVPRALRVLGYRTSLVGSDEDGQPPRGSRDEVIVAHATKTNQVIVTSNHDMMQICAESGQRFVWIDPRGRQLTRPEQVLLVFQQIDRWAELFDQRPSDAVHAMRSTCRSIDPHEAARRVGHRELALQRRKRLTAPRRKPVGNLLGVFLAEK